MNDSNGVIHCSKSITTSSSNTIPIVPTTPICQLGARLSAMIVIHWQERPIAIAPTPNSPDQGGIFSGCIANGRTRITSRFYLSSSDNQGLRVLNAAALRALDIWELSSIW